MQSPTTMSAAGVAIAHQDGQGNWRRMCPDFIFFHGNAEEVHVSIADPHGHHLADALPKINALAELAAACSDVFHRVEAIAADDGGGLRVIDLKSPHIRQEIAVSEDIWQLYKSSAAAGYV